MSSLSEERVQERIKDKPPGIQFLEHLKKSHLSFNTYKAIVLILTFLAYTSYHATRKTTSIVKSAFDSQTIRVLGNGWAPFKGSDGTALVGYLDLAFLLIYAVGMYFSGHLGDRKNLRMFLTFGMIGTGFFTLLFGVGYWANIHFFLYYLVVQMFAGLFQSTGWPCVVAVVGNWYGKKRRGLIMGIWNSHRSIGNIAGSMIASAFLKYGWGWSMVIPGLIVMFVGLLVFLLLPVSPEAVEADNNEESLEAVGTDNNESVEESNEAVGDVDSDNNEVIEESLVKIGEEITELQVKSEPAPIGFLEAWKIPGVVPFACCLFFAKLVTYLYLCWLPIYISHTAIDGKSLSNEAAGRLSRWFDVGGVVGGILAGYISDRLNAPAIPAAAFMYCSIPSIVLYRSYGHVSMSTNAILMVITGILVNGPYALITTAVSADLGTHSSLKRNSRALATVTAIIDGTGSIGAAICPLLTSYISATSWTAVFSMLVSPALVAGLCLTKLVVAEVRAKIE